MDDEVVGPATADVPDDYKAAVARLSRDLRKASETLSETEARYLVQAYYNLQDQRIRSTHQVRMLNKFDQPHVVISWLGEQSRILEDQIRAALDRYSRNHRYALWPRSIVGIGPVICAGLIAHTHMEHLTTAGHLWSFAGLNPTQKWDRSQKRPWNAELKTLCWKIGQSFMKVQAHPDDVYGRIYKVQKTRYIERNDIGGFADNAQHALQNKKWDKSKAGYQVYLAGKLPPGHIDAMARRYAVKLFLSHYWQAAWEIDHPGRTPPLPYPIVHMGHAHVIEMPNRHLIAEAIAHENTKGRERVSDEASAKAPERINAAKSATRTG